MDGGDGIICIALVVVALILSYLHKDIVALGLAGATAVLAVYEIFNAKSVNDCVKPDLESKVPIADKLPWGVAEPLIAEAEVCATGAILTGTRKSF